MESVGARQSPLQKLWQALKFFDNAISEAVFFMKTIEWHNRKGVFVQLTIQTLETIIRLSNSPTTVERQSVKADRPLPMETN